MPAAGLYDRIIQIQHAVEVQDETGQPVREWQNYLEPRWSNVRHLAGREITLAQQLVANVDTQFLLRYDLEIKTVSPDETFRIAYDGLLYDIQYSREYTSSPRRREWRILATARSEVEEAPSSATASTSASIVRDLALLLTLARRGLRG
jgi:SPP1 family predicted phage head-tail adaptor